MSIKVTTTQDSDRRGSFAIAYRKATVFVKSNATEFIDDFFNKHKIWGLDFKCKTWAALGREAHKLNVAEMRTVLGSNATITYSHKAGCSCGCSPGYKVSGDFDSSYRGKWVWVDIEVDLTELKAMMPKFEAKLKKELEDQQLPVETAA